MSMRPTFTSSWAALLLVAASLFFAFPVRAQLAATDLRIAGRRPVVEDTETTTPKNQATGIVVRLVDASRPDDALPSGFQTVDGGRTTVVRATLSGPGLTEPLSLSVEVPPDHVPTPPDGDQNAVLLPVPALPVAGHYLLEDIRLTDSMGNLILQAEPSVTTINVVDRVLITGVSTRPLSLEEIQSRGILLDANSFTAFEFTVGFGTLSNSLPIKLDMAFKMDTAPVGGLVYVTAVDTDTQHTAAREAPTLQEREDLRVSIRWGGRGVTGARSGCSRVA